MIKSIYLASTSPRRKSLLEKICLDLHIKMFILKTNPTANTKEFEKPRFNEKPINYVKRIALKKVLTAEHWLKKNNITKYPILTGDTIVCFENQILLKPSSKEEAFEMLKKLSDNKHKVISSVALSLPSLIQNTWSIKQKTVSTTVWFAKIPDEWILKYIRTNDPMDKSGAYAIQGNASMFIKKINGSYSSVVGLPLVETRELLQIQ